MFKFRIPKHKPVVSALRPVGPFTGESVDELTKPRSEARPYTLTLYKAKDGWRWRLVAPNGKLTAESGEAYKRRYDCREAAERLVTQPHGIKVQGA